MSPAPRSRRLRNQTAPVKRSRRELTIAIAGSAVILLVTVVIIWAMRPGSANSFTPGKGGLIHRQPKASLWLLVTGAAIASVAWYYLRRDSKVRNPRRAVVLSISGVVVAAAVVMGVWHDSLVHDYAVPTVPTVPTSLPPLNTTVPARNTTAPTTAPGTTAPATTAPATTAPAPSTTGG